MCRTARTALCLPSLPLCGGDALCRSPPSELATLLGRRGGSVTYDGMTAHTGCFIAACSRRCAGIIKLSAAVTMFRGDVLPGYHPQRHFFSSSSTRLPLHPPSSQDVCAALHTLGITTPADCADPNIKAAYTTLAKLYHPDVRDATTTSSNSTSTDMSAITHSYHLLRGISVAQREAALRGERVHPSSRRPVTSSYRGQSDFTYSPEEYARAMKTYRGTGHRTQKTRKAQRGRTPQRDDAAADAENVVPHSTASLNRALYDRHHPTDRTPRRRRDRISGEDEGEEGRRASLLRAAQEMWSQQVGAAASSRSQQRRRRVAAASVDAQLNYTPWLNEQRRHSGPPHRWQRRRHSQFGAVVAVMLAWVAYYYYYYCDEEEGTASAVK